MPKKETYDASSISVLEGLEAVRKRPGMYIGSTSRKGLNHLIYEIVDNAVDEHLAGYCDTIHVTLEADGSATVTDNGRGIPVGMHEKGVPAERLVFTTLHAGGKFDNNAYKTSGGLHGVGSSVVNALSTYLDVQVSLGGWVYHDRYERGVAVQELDEDGLLPKIGKTKNSGTRINFLPDPEIFEKTRFSATEVKSRLHETAYLNPALTIYFSDLRVDGTRRPEQVPTENTDWFNYCGVYRDIALIRVPKCHIKTFKIALVPDGTFGHVMAKVTLSEKITAKAELVIEELGVSRKIQLENGAGEVVFDAKPELWTPEKPKLYDVKVTCGTDTVSDRVGFREIRVNGRDILLNGEPVFLRGISCHEDSVENGKGLTREERIENIRIAKELGCNFMRLAHYPHNEEMAKLADELGLLLWEEIPVYWAIRFEREKTYEDAKNQLRELINRDWNRASVIIWSVGNENADTDERLKFMSALAECAHREDETRMVSAACLVNAAKNKIEDRLMEYLDIIGINEYCGWYTPDFAMLPALMENSQPDKPVIVTEFGADALPHHHGTISDKGTEECQADVYEKQIATLRNIDYIKGMTPWILYDFRCPRRTSLIQKYYNRKGLLSEDKKYRKPAFYVLQKFYEELKRKEQ